MKSEIGVYIQGGAFGLTQEKWDAMTPAEKAKIIKKIEEREANEEARKKYEEAAAERKKKEAEEKAAADKDKPKSDIGKYVKPDAQGQAAEEDDGKDLDIDTAGSALTDMEKAQEEYKKKLRDKEKQFGI